MAAESVSKPLSISTTPLQTAHSVESPSIHQQLVQELN